MQLIRGLNNLKLPVEGSVATIGAFDGVHLGHQQVLAQLRAASCGLDLPAVLVSFEPTPREYFNPGSAPPRLTRLAEKLPLLAKAGVDLVLILPFNHQLAELEATGFCQRVLLDALKTRHLVIGDDFHFGKGRKGNFEFLQDFGAQNSFRVERTESYILGEGRVSSSRIRDMLSAGDMAGVESLLGRPYALCGRVAHGHKRGRSIGFPTANLYLNRHKCPVRGVFAVSTVLDGKPVQGVANVGNRPTVDGDDRYLLEVHLFDFDSEIYGQKINVTLCDKIRDEIKFESFDDLKTQILQDCEVARKYFRTGK